MILFKYLNREVFVTMLVITLVLLAIFISNQFVRYLGDAAIGRVTAEAVIQLMLIQIPLLSGFMLPLGYFMGLLVSYGRMHADSEMIVLFSSGVSKERLLKFTMIGAAIVSVMVAVLMIWVEPEMAWYRDHILARAAAASPLQKLAPERFHVIGGRWVFFVEELSRDHDSMNNVFAAELPEYSKYKNTKNSVLVAEKARQTTDEQGHQFIEFDKGSRYLGNPGDPNYQIVEFKKYGIKIPERPIHLSKLEEFAPTIQLWRERNTNRLAAAELQWRLSMPLSVLILALFAMPLSQVRPRQGKFARFLPAIIIYTIYIDLLFVSQSWVQKGLVGTGIGMWWVHAVMLLGGLTLCSFYMGWFKRVWTRMKIKT